MNACFLAQGDGVYEPTEHTGGAWRDDEQHLAPVAGLIVHHMERWREEHVGDSLVLSRLSFEVLGQIPRETVHLCTEVVRAGRTIELIETTATIGDRVIIRARAWLLQVSDTTEVAANQFDTLPFDDTEVPLRMGTWPGAFIRSVWVKRVQATEPGRGRVWMTTELDLVSGEPRSELAEFLMLADTANGVAPLAAPGEWMFPNVDLTIHLFRHPSGRWRGFDTRVAFGSTGVGVTSSVLHDEWGVVGTIHQSLTIRRLS